VRCDAIQQFDSCVGQIMATLDRLKNRREHAADGDQRYGLWWMTAMPMAPWKRGQAEVLPR